MPAVTVESLQRVSQLAVKCMGLVLVLPVGLICGFSRPILLLWLGRGFPAPAAVADRSDRASGREHGGAAPVRPEHRAEQGPRSRAGRAGDRRFQPAAGGRPGQRRMGRPGHRLVRRRFHDLEKPPVHLDLCGPHPEAAAFTYLRKLLVAVLNGALIGLVNGVNRLVAVKTFLTGSAGRSDGLGIFGSGIPFALKHEEKSLLWKLLPVRTRPEFNENNLCVIGWRGFACGHNPDRNC